METDRIRIQVELISILIFFYAVRPLFLQLSFCKGINCRLFCFLSCLKGSFSSYTSLIDTDTVLCKESGFVGILTKTL